jgi:hypothetical protein
MLTCRLLVRPHGRRWFNLLLAFVLRMKLSLLFFVKVGVAERIESEFSTLGTN